MMIYSGKKDALTGVTYLIIVIICTTVMGLVVDGILRDGQNGLFFVLFPLAMVNGFLVWIWVDTKYMIYYDNFEYHSGPFRGKISIDEISRITRNKTLWVGVRKPALAKKGMIMHYGKGETIYIAPADQEGVITAMLEINPGIAIE